MGRHCMVDDAAPGTDNYFEVCPATKQTDPIQSYGWGFHGAAIGGLTVPCLYSAAVEQPLSPLS